MSEPDHEQLCSAVELIMMGAVVVFIIFFLVIVYVYLRVKRSYHVGEYSSPDHHGHAPPAVRHGLDPALIPVAVTVLIKELAAGLQCAVCLCELSDGEAARMLPRCSHGFHLECIDMWLHSNNNCPLCRTPVVSIDQLSSSPLPVSRLDDAEGMRSSPTLAIEAVAVACERY